jgi:DNA-directed RNA polymerase specialized sigma24 family protein
MSVGVAGSGTRGSLDAVNAIRAGSPDVLAALYREYGRVLYRLAYRLTGTREDAEDVLHDCSLACRKRWGATRSGAASPAG